MANNFPNLMKNNLNFQVAQQTRINAKRATPRHIMIKMIKDKKEIFKIREKCTRKPPPIRINS